MNPERYHFNPYARQFLADLDTDPEQPYLRYFLETPTEKWVGTIGPFNRYRDHPISLRQLAGMMGYSPEGSRQLIQRVTQSLWIRSSENLRDRHPLTSTFQAITNKVPTSKSVIQISGPKINDLPLPRTVLSGVEMGHIGNLIRELVSGKDSHAFGEIKDLIGVDCPVPVFLYNGRYAYPLLQTKLMRRYLKRKL